MKQVEKFDFLEIDFNCGENSAYIENCAEFVNGKTVLKTGAFRKGDKFAVRFSPMEEGQWDYTIKAPGGEEVKGSFECVKNSGDNHGKVIAVGDKFTYADGAKYYPFGTTCYAWVNQPKELQDKTVETLKNSPFNKIRMCVFPKSMPYNNNEPDCFPYEKTDGKWDMSKPVEEFWSNFDLRMSQLCEIGVEADIILYHPYDRWGFAELSQEDSIEYLNYCIYRLGAYRNVWWSLANEYDTVFSKTNENWDEYGEILKKKDIYEHLISIHDMVIVYPDRDWMTHASVQSGDIDNIVRWKQSHGGKPVVIDEYGYEGDIEYNWGNLTAFEEMNRCWKAVFRGGFATHGETFHRDDEVLWWAKGGELYGESPKRIAFLKDIIYSLPDDWKAVAIPIANVNEDKNKEVSEADAKTLEHNNNVRKLMERASEEERFKFMIAISPMKIEGKDFQFNYLGTNCACRATYKLEGKNKIEVIDAWNMTRETVMENASGNVIVPLPAKEGIAVMITKTGE